MKKKLLGLALCLPLVVAAVTGAALAADAGGGTTTPPVNGPVTNKVYEKATIEYDETNGFTVTCEGLTAGEQYALLMLKTNGEDSTPPTSIAEEDIMYIDQDAATTENKVTFSNFKPKTLTTSKFILGGKFTNEQGQAVTSPLLLGTVKVSGVEVTGKVYYRRFVNPLSASVALIDSEGNTVDTVTTTTTSTDTDENALIESSYSFSGVAPGEGYKVVVTKPSHCRYILTDVNISGDQSTVPLPDISMVDLAGDVYSAEGDTTDTIGQADLTLLLQVFLETATDEGGISAPEADINNSGQVNSSDLTILLQNFLQDQIVVSANSTPST